MDYQEQDQKGLFTFYKEQQAQQDEIRDRMRKKKKAKNRKSKKKIDEDRKSIFKMEQGLLESASSHKLPEQFLKNVIGKYNKASHCLKIVKEKQARVKSQSTEDVQVEKFTPAILIKQKRFDKTKSHQFGRLMFRQKDKESLAEKELSEVNQKINQLHTKIFNSEIMSPKRRYEFVSIAKIEALKIDEGVVVSRACKNEQKSFLDKIKYLENGTRSAKSNLISNRESVNKDRQRLAIEQQNRRYFQQLIGNYSKRHDQSYKVLNKSLKFPHITNEDKYVRMKTEEGSPVKSQKKLLTPIKSFSSQKKSIKLYGQRCQDLYRIKMDAVGHLDSSKDRKILNMIDLSREYSGDVIDSQDRILKKRLLKSKLGIEL